MRTRPPGAGRKSKGDRHLFHLGRLSPEQTDEILRRAADRGLTHSEYLAVVIEREHGFATPWPPRTTRLLSNPRTHLDHPQLACRVPRAAAIVVMDAAEARDIAYRRYVTAVVARAHGFPADLPEPVAAHQPQEALIGA